MPSVKKLLFFPDDNNNKEQPQAGSSRGSSLDSATAKAALAAAKADAKDEAKAAAKAAAKKAAAKKTTKKFKKAQQEAQEAEEEDCSEGEGKFYFSYTMTNTILEYVPIFRIPLLIPCFFNFFRAPSLRYRRLGLHQVQLYPSPRDGDWFYHESRFYRHVHGCN